MYEVKKADGYWCVVMWGTGRKTPVLISTHDTWEDAAAAADLLAKR